MATRLLGAKLNLLSVRDVMNARDGTNRTAAGCCFAVRDRVRHGSFGTRARPASGAKWAWADARGTTRGLPALARELYPEPKRTGRKKWTSLNRGALVVEIERLVKPGDPARGVSWAAAQLAKREP